MKQKKYNLQNYEKTKYFRELFLISNIIGDL